ncbi:MAG: hypothetical protein Q8O38_10000 [Sulfurimicrobium sp.]|nr:hypothetical protein [Sulfurimicrobium sp.]
MPPNDPPTANQPQPPSNASAVIPHPAMTETQLQAIERCKRETGTDMTPIVNLVMRMRENPKIEQALTQAMAQVKKDHVQA